MTVIISMLRGVNVGGHNKIKMDALRALYTSLKLRDAQTYVQSGNVIFRTDERDIARLTKRIEDGIERKFGFRPDVILRTAAEMRDVVARNPFAKRRGIEPGKLLVTFLASDPPAEVREKVRQIKCDPEELRIEGRELYIRRCWRWRRSWKLLSRRLCVDKFAAFQLRQGLDRPASFLLGKAQVIEVLKIEPKLSAGAKEMSEAESGVARHRACAIQNLRDAIGGHAELSRQFRGAHIERFQFLGQVFTRMNYSNGHSGSPSDSQQSPRAMVRATRPATRSKFAIDR